MLRPVLGERERKTLAFVMSLPATPKDAAVAKLLAAFVMFLIPGTDRGDRARVLSPVDVFAAMAARTLVLSRVARLLRARPRRVAALLLDRARGGDRERVDRLDDRGPHRARLRVRKRRVCRSRRSWYGSAAYLRELARGGPALLVTLGAEAVGHRARRRRDARASGKEDELRVIDFESLYERHAAAVFRFALSLSGDRSAGGGHHVRDVRQGLDGALSGSIFETVAGLSPHHRPPPLPARCRARAAARRAPE